MTTSNRQTAARLQTARTEYDAAVKAAGAGDLKARAQLTQLRREIEDLEREFAVQADVDAEAARRNRNQAAAAERQRVRVGLNQVDATFTEQLALAKHADALFDEIDTTLRKLEAIGVRVVEQFRTHCPESRLAHAFCGLGLHGGDALEDDMYKRLWQIRPIERALIRNGAGARTIFRAPSLHEAARLTQRRALDILDQARAVVAEPAELPPAA